MEQTDRGSQCRRIALLIQYDGSEFYGWQIQNQGRTIQGEIGRALKVLTGENIVVTGSGRTDAGVHALGQVAHFDTFSSLPLYRFARGLNGIMDNGISVKNAYHVKSDFHSRYDAVEREYLYLIYNAPLKSPFMYNRALWVPYQVDLDQVRRIVDRLLGKRDFAAFCKKQSADQTTTVRDLRSITVTRQEELIQISIKADAFLHNMIRIIVGTIFEFVRDSRDPAEIDDILAAGSREASGITASPCGLYLKNVSYDPPLDSYPMAFDSSW